MKGSGFHVSFVVENKTGSDFNFPQSAKFFKRNVKTQALEEVKLALDHPFVIPAHERAQLTASMEYSCSEENLDTGKTTEREGKECFQDAFGDVSEFVAFDYDSRTRLNLPKPTFYAGTEQTPKPAANSVAPDFIPASAAVAPDNAKPWNKYWAARKRNGSHRSANSQKMNLTTHRQRQAGGLRLVRCQRWCVHQRATLLTLVLRRAKSCTSGTTTAARTEYPSRTLLSIPCTLFRTSQR